jgi:uroporphyrinogen III methyltransferase/synthase
MVTRPEDPHDPLAEQLGWLGAEVIVQPAIRIAPPADWRPVDAALARSNEFDWLVFSSANGVSYLLDRLRETGTQLVSKLKLAAIGPGTADELARYGLRADLVPEQYRAEALAEALTHEAPGRRFLLARASRGREVLAQQLSAAGATVEQIVVYSSSDVQEPDPAAAALLRAGRIDWITVTSSAIARSLVRLFGDDLRRAKLASISPITTGTLRELGHLPAAEAAEYTVDGLVAAIVNVR